MVDLTPFKGRNDISLYLRPVNGKRVALTVSKYAGKDIYELWDKSCMEYGTVMDSSDYEKERNIDIVEKTRGDVFIAGFGIGLIVLPIINKEEVISVDIMESQQEVIDLIASQLPLNKKVNLIKGNYFDYEPEKKYDTIYLDTVPEEMCTKEDKTARCRGDGYYMRDRDMVPVFSKYLKKGGIIRTF